MYTIESIDYFFHTYYENFITSVSWEDRLLEPSEKTEWLKKLRQCADDQQRFCSENQSLLETYLYPLKSNPELLSEDGYDSMLTFCRKFYYSRITEPVLLLEFVDILLPHYQARNDIESLIFLYSCGGYAHLEISRTGDKIAAAKAADFYEKAISYRDFIDTFDSPISREYIFVAYYNLIRIAPELSIVTLDRAFELWQELCQLRTQEKFCKYDEENPRIPYICNKVIDDFLAYGTVLNILPHDASPHIIASLNTMSKQRYLQQLKELGSIHKCTPSLVFNYYMLLTRGGEISPDEGWRILDDYYTERERTAQDDPELDKLAFYCNLPINLIDILNQTSFSEDFKQPYYKKYRNLIVNCLTNQPIGLNAYTLSNGVEIVCFHPLVLGTFNNRAEKLNFIFELVVSKHLSSFTHSVMVSYLAEAIVKRIFESAPEILYIPSGVSSDTVLAKQADIIDFAVRAALLHDLGKNGLIPIINTQHRRLTDYEFEIIRTHPDKGAEYLSSDPDFTLYQDIALGHHKSYDGTRGYPPTFDNTSSTYRSAIDLIHICDCLDAATDYLSRNYHRAKPFDMVMDELRAGSGTEYNPIIVNFILNNTELYQELKHLTEENREHIYYDIYQTFINIKRI